MLGLHEARLIRSRRKQTHHHTVDDRSGLGVGVRDVFLQEELGVDPLRHDDEAEPDVGIDRRQEVVDRVDLNLK